MSTANTNTPSLTDRVGAFFATLRQRRAANAVYRQTSRELHALTDRELADLGIVRSQIRSIAYQAAYDN